MPQKFHDFFLIISPKKTGSSSLFNYLAQHPEISASSFKEPGFFVKEERWSKGMDWYYDLWSFDPARHKYAMEASTDYSHIPRMENAAKRVAEMAEKHKLRFKFLYVMRDPVDRLEQQHFQDFYVDHWIEKPISDQVDPGILESSKYARQLDEFYQRFPAEDILLMHFEDMKSDLDGMLKKICNFLGIDPDFKFDTSVIHNQKASAVGYGSGVWQFFRNIAFFRTLGYAVPSELKDKVRAFLGKRAMKNIKDSDYKLTPDAYAGVVEELKPDMIRLRDQYGFDISRWSSMKALNDD